MPVLGRGDVSNLTESRRTHLNGLGIQVLIKRPFEIKDTLILNFNNSVGQGRDELAVVADKNQSPSPEATGERRESIIYTESRQ